MNIYITKQNETKLRNVSDNTMSGLINFLLGEYFKTHRVDEKGSVEAKSMDELYGIAKQHDVMKRDKSIEEVSKILEPRANTRFAGPLCKIHRLPVDDRGKCLQKGCKYG